MDKNVFIERVAKVAVEKYDEYGILPSLVIAQAILESGWGEKPIENNIFGIKASSSWQGRVATRRTKEWDGEKFITVEAKFRAYDSIEDSIMDYLKLVGRTKRYERVKKAQDYKEAARLIYEAGYATDPLYSKKLIDIIEARKLYKYDQVKDTLSPWAMEAWNWAKEMGITDGTRPRDYMTREEGITILYRLFCK